MRKLWSKTGKLFSLLLAATTAFTACTDDNEDFRQSAGKALDIQVAVKPTSRAMVMGTALPEGAQIGVNVTATDGSEYDGQNVGYLNVPYTATGTGTSQTWGSTAPVMLSGTEGLMYAYFPYTQGIDYTAVAVDIADQHDWMYGTEAYSVSDKAPSADVVLAHAQTALNINVVRANSYTGEGLVEALAITSEGLASTGTLDTRDGSWTAQAGANTAISIISAPFTLDGTTLTNQENPYMFVPASDETKDFTVSATVDGKAYNVGVAMNEAFAPGKMYQLNVKVTNTGLTVSKVTLIDWVIDTTLPDAEFKPHLEDKYAVTFILSKPYEEGGEDLTSFAPDVDKIGATSVYAGSRSTSKAVDFFLTDTYEGYEDMGLSGIFSEEMASPRSLVAKMTIDGTEVVPSRYVLFEDSEDHEIKVWFKTLNKIPDNAFTYSSCKQFNIPEGITEIGDGAFQDTSIRDLYLHAGISVIGNAAFAGEYYVSIEVAEDNPYFHSGRENKYLMRKSDGELMAAVKGIAIPSETKIIGDYVFQFVFSGETLNIPEGVVRIGKYAFNECYTLPEKVVIPSSCKIIDERAFVHTYFTGVEFNEGLEVIGRGAFSGCEYLTGELNLPNSLKRIERGAFESTNFTKLTMGTGLEFIGDWAFAYNRNMTGTITIPQGVTEIGEGAFESCESLTGTLTIPNTIKKIGKTAFQRCSGFTNILLNNNLEEIGEAAFYECTGFNGSLTLPNSVKVIGKEAFERCGLRGEIYIPKAVESIGIGAFKSNDGITSIRVDASNPYYNDGNGKNVIFEKATATLIEGCNYSMIPEDCRIIAEDAFYNCDGLTSLSFPEGLKEIHTYAFYGCEGLTELRLPESLEILGYGAFNYCDAVTLVTFGSKVKSIYSSFNGCTSLKTIYAKMNPAAVLKNHELAGSSFCNAAYNGTLYVPTGATGYEPWMKSQYAFLGYYNWRKVEIDEFPY